MTQLHADHCKTSFASPDEIVAHLIGNEELLAVCPGQITIEPHPEPPATATPKENKKTNIVITIVILFLFVIVASAFPELLHHGIEVIFGLIALPIVIFAFMMGIRIPQNALVMTVANAWCIFGMVYNKKQNSYHFNIATCTPREEVKKISWVYRTLRVKMSNIYMVKIFQSKTGITKHYTKKATDIVKVNMMFPPPFQVFGK